MRRVSTAALLVLAACATAGRMSDDNAPPHAGGIAAVWAGQRMLVLYYEGQNRFAKIDRPHHRRLRLVREVARSAQMAKCSAACDANSR